MLPFLIYEGKVAVALAVFSLFYRLLLKRESFHRLNRRVLVGAMIVSFLLPMCVITIHKPMELASQQATVTTTTGNTPGAWWPTALSILYFAGVAFVLARELVSILSVLRIIRQGEQVREQDGCKIIITNRDIGPFSGENAPDSVDIQYWTTPEESPIKTIRLPVTDGRFEAEISSRVTQFSEVLIPGDIVAFIADGSTLAIDMETHQVTSSNPYGVRRIPDMILFGPDGTILLRNFWGYDDQILDSIIGRYLRGERPAQPGVL